MFYTFRDHLESVVATSHVVVNHSAKCRNLLEDLPTCTVLATILAKGLELGKGTFVKVFLKED